ncbi:MAG TPA: DcaP family trimeric outer membrane transporter [Dokdonella sp.]|uniref:DcaP family trimeric outer membrane transporter n=1 Tax=Dokdonella sp. TaxID=2291710 RepID=UPI002C74067E|nr:DcaP family trimeric outer membrane transporter [Dokdonella sp.]HOX71209.1 DcaP family trimeric outer membrane transporter [Dokdonella sp.]
MIKKFTGLRLSALSLACLMAMPGIAMANEAREQALEQRINDLEKQLQSLAAEIRAQREAAPVAAAPALPAGKLPIQLTTLTPGSPSGTTVKIGGFIKADFMATKASDGQLADGAVGRALYVPGQTPVGGESSDVDYDAHAKFSRFNIGVDTITDGGDKAGAFVEMDFFGNALGTQVATNTYGVTVRHAYAYWNNWLAGQTWSNFMDTAALPDSVDFIGPTDGVLFVRQSQIRYTSGGFSASLENPETTIIPNGGGGTIQSDRGALPDLTLRYGWKGDWGSFGLGALFRSLDIDRAATATASEISDSEGAFAFTVGGKWVLGKHDDLRYQLTAGDGVSRYIGLGITGDAALSSTGDLDAIGGTAGYVAWRHVYSPKLRSNLIYARSQYDNPIDLTGTGVNESVQSFRINLFYSPMPKLDVGVELMRANRELESGVDGSLTRLQFTTKYSF